MKILYKIFDVTKFANGLNFHNLSTLYEMNNFKPLLLKRIRYICS